jgi:hypothetical protein
MSNCEPKRPNETQQNALRHGTESEKHGFALFWAHSSPFFIQVVCCMKKEHVSAAETERD